MKPLTDKQFQRIENKKKKMAAFLEIAKLNDKDRETETKHRTRGDTSSDSSDEETCVENFQKKKKRKTHHDLFPDAHCTQHLDERIPEFEDDEGFGGSPPADDTRPQDRTAGSKSKAVEHGGGYRREDKQDVALGPRGKPMLDGEEFAKLRAELRERKKRLTKLPLFRLRAEGEKASIDVKEDDRTPLFLSDVQHLLLYSLIGTHAPYSPFAWCQFEKHNRVSHTVVLMIESLSLYDFLAYQSCFPHITAEFATKLEIITPSAYNGNFAEELALIPMTHNKEILMIQRYGSLEGALRADGDVYRLFRAIFPVLISDETAPDEPPTAATNQPTTANHPAHMDCDLDEPLQYVALAHNDRFPRTQLIMSPSQLIDENFPIPLKGALKAKYKDYILTKDLYKEATPTSPMFSLDCEMCMTTAGVLELTRISIVDEKLSCLYDTLVLPYNRIVNYLTRFSGITPKMMQGVTKRLEEVQHDIRTMLPMDAILVGQSLNSDLHTLRMMHPYVIDTSVIYNVTSNYRRKTKLSTLSLKFLGEQIQHSASGHCSTEDSEACMKLVQLKLANSLAFGDTILASYRPEYRSLTQPVSTDSSAPPTCYIKFDENQSLQVDTTNQPTIYQYYPVADTQSASSTNTNAEKKDNGEHLATTLFSYLKKRDKTVGIVSTPDIINEYSRWISKKTNKRSPGSDKTVNNVSVSDNRNVLKRTKDVAAQHAFTIGHVRYDEAVVTGMTEQQKSDFFKEVDASCKEVWDSVATSGLCIVMFGGRRGGANGACFIQIKRTGAGLKAST